MKRRIFSLIAIAFSVYLSVAGSARANQVDDIFNPADEYGFTDENRVSSEDLSGMRGGFMIGGLEINFAITTRTLVDGILQHTTTLTTNNMSSGHEVNQALVNNGTLLPGTSNVTVESVISNQAVITTIQNTTDGAVIQQFNQMDVNVSNMAALQAANLAPQIDFQAVQALY